MERSSSSSSSSEKPNTHEHTFAPQASTFFRRRQRIRQCRLYLLVFLKKNFKRTGNLKMTLHGNWKNVGGAKKANQSCNLSEFGHPLSLSRKSKTEENWKLSTIIRQSKVSDGNWYFPLTAVSIMWRVSCLFPPPPGWSSGLSCFFVTPPSPYPHRRKVLIKTASRLVTKRKSLFGKLWRKRVTRNKNTLYTAARMWGSGISCVAVRFWDKFESCACLWKRSKSWEKVTMFSSFFFENGSTCVVHSRLRKRENGILGAKIWEPS